MDKKLNRLTFYCICKHGMCTRCVDDEISQISQQAKKSGMEIRLFFGDFICEKSEGREAGYEIIDEHEDTILRAHQIKDKETLRKISRSRVSCEENPCVVYPHIDKSGEITIKTEFIVSENNSVQ